MATNVLEVSRLCRLGTRFHHRDLGEGAGGGVLFGSFSADISIGRGGGAVEFELRRNPQFTNNIKKKKRKRSKNNRDCLI